MAAMLKGVACALLLCAPVTVSAQPWLPTKGEGSISTGVQVFHVGWHLEHDGSRQEETNLQIRNVTFDVTYGLTNKLAVDVGVPHVASRYGALSHPCPDPVPGYLPCSLPESSIDNGTYYATWQDVRASVRYGLWTRHVTLTPTVGVVLPSRGYETHGHAAPGRHLREVDLGVYGGRSLGPWLPKTFVEGGYLYAVSQRVIHHELDVGLNRSNAELAIGHQVTTATVVRAFVSWQHTHGGLEWVDELFVPGNVHEEIHDQAASARFWRAGATLSYAVSHAFAIDASVLTTVAGANTHKVGGIALGATWSFGLGNGVIGAVGRD